MPTRTVPDTHRLQYFAWTPEVLDSLWALEIRQAEDSVEQATCLYGEVRDTAVVVMAATSPVFIRIQAPGQVEYGCRVTLAFIGSAHTHAEMPTLAAIQGDLYYLTQHKYALFFAIVGQGNLMVLTRERSFPLWEYVGQR